MPRFSFIYYIILYKTIQSISTNFSNKKNLVRNFVHKYKGKVTFIVDSDMQSMYPIILKTLIMCCPVLTLVSYLCSSVFVPTTFFGSKKAHNNHIRLQSCSKPLIFTKTPSILFLLSLIKKDMKAIIVASSLLRH